jgi:ketopantoate reductase
MNTTTSIGVESYLEQRFPTNVVLSLVSGAEIVQLGASEFEHKGATDIWVGPANRNAAIPAQIQSDMAEALAMTLSSGQVDCKVSPNIRQQQYERMIGYVVCPHVFRLLTHYSPISFHPASIIFETPNHAELMEKVGARAMITGVLDELLALAKAQECTFPADFRETTLRRMTQPQETNSTMWLDFESKRPMEIETYLGSPLKLAQEVGVSVPRIETLYAILHHLNITNRNRPAASTTPIPPQAIQPQPPPRLASAPLPRGPPGPGGPMINGNGPMMNGNGPMMNGNGPMMNGNGPMMKGGPRAGSRAPSINGAPPPMRRGPPPGANGYPPRMNGAPNGQRRSSFDDNDLGEFSHLMLYDDMLDGGVPSGPYESAGSSSNNLSLRERELMLRQRELQIREQELNMRRGPPGPGPMPGMGRGRPPPPASNAGYDDEDDEDDYFDPMGGRGPGQMADPDNFDMMSVTSRRNRKMPSASQIRKNPEGFTPGAGGGRSRNPFTRPGANKNRTSARLMADVPGLHDSIMNNPLLGYSSNRYADVDRGAMGAQSRTNSLTAARLDEMGGGMGGGYGAYPAPNPRRISQSPGNPLSPGPRPMGRPSPPNGYAPNGINGMPSNGMNGMPPNGMNGMPPNGMNGMPPNGMNGMPPNGMNGMPPNGRPSPPGMRQPVPRHPPGHGNAVAPQQVEQHAGVSNLYPPKSRHQVRSLTGSASASSGNIDSEKNSAHSSQSSIGPRPPVGVR